MRGWVLWMLGGLAVAVALGFWAVGAIREQVNAGYGSVAEEIARSEEIACAEAATPVPPTSRDALAGESMIAPGAAILPDDVVALDPSAYSTALASRIPVEIGMEQFTAKDEFLVYYNDGLGPTARVSMTERTVNGATVFVIRRLGLSDDSVSGEESFALFDAGALQAYGTRIQCARGESAGAWTTALCP